MLPGGQRRPPLQGAEEDFGLCRRADEGIGPYRVRLEFARGLGENRCVRRADRGGAGMRGGGKVGEIMGAEKFFLKMATGGHRETLAVTAMHREMC